MAAAVAQSPTSTKSAASPASPLVKTAERREECDEAKWRPVLGLACELAVDLRIPNFRVSDFLRLRPGSVVSTHWRLTRDVPLRANGVLLAWVEFERTGEKLAVRLTELG